MTDPQPVRPSNHPPNPFLRPEAAPYTWWAYVGGDGMIAPPGATPDDAQRRVLDYLREVYDETSDVDRDGASLADWNAANLPGFVDGRIVQLYAPNEQEAFRAFCTLHRSTATAGFPLWRRAFPRDGDGPDPLLDTVSTEPVATSPATPAIDTPPPSPEDGRIGAIVAAIGRWLLADRPLADLEHAARLLGLSPAVEVS